MSLCVECGAPATPNHYGSVHGGGRSREFATGRLPEYEDAYYGDATVHHLPVELVSRFKDPSAAQNPRKVAGIVRGLKAGEPIREAIHLIPGNGGEPFLWDGHHRLEAARKAGLTHVPVKVTL